MRGMIGAGVAAKSLHGLKVCVIPRPENNYQPLALRRRALTAVSACIVVAKVLALSLIIITPATAELSTITTARIIQLTNEERVKAGLGELTVNAKLTEAAKQKASDMIEKDYFAHISPSGVTPWFWMAKQSYTYQQAGENLAIDFVEAEDVVEAWMASPSHKANIVENNYTETGVAALTGEYQGSTSTVVVHMFGRPAGEQASQVLSGSAGQDIVEPQTTPIPATTSTPSGLPIPATSKPKAPRISLINIRQDGVIGENVEFKLTATAGETAYFLVDDKLFTTVGLPETGEALIKLNLGDKSDGEIKFSAYVRDAAGGVSEKSKQVKVTKITVGPQLERTRVIGVAGPATDRPVAIILKPNSDFQSLSVEIAGVQLTYEAVDETAWPLNVPIENEPIILVGIGPYGNRGDELEVNYQPSFFVERDISFVNAPVKFSIAARRLLMTVLLVIIILLLMAVFIRIRVQKPRIIVHASLVILLAAAMLMI